MRYNHRTISDVIDYIHSERYDNKNIALEKQIQKLAEKAIRGEIPLELWQRLRADLLLENNEPKKKQNLIGYG